jgi:capsid assembly protease
MLASIKGQQWMIRPDLVSEFALSALEAPTMSSDLLAEYYPMRKASEVDANGIAIVEAKGALLNSGPRIYEKLGIATYYGTIISEMSAAIDAGAQGILLDVNSPGGTVAGNAEAAAFIAASPIPVEAFVSGMACSAAYKLAAGSSAIIASQSASVGNIGTILSWMDCDEFWASQGITMKALTNQGADLKSTFHLEPDETQIEFLQESINEAGAAFRAHVEAYRPGIDSEVFRAGWYSGERAESLGLIDGIGGMQDAYDDLLTRTI